MKRELQNCDSLFDFIHNYQSKHFSTRVYFQSKILKQSQHTHDRITWYILLNNKSRIISRGLDTITIPQAYL